MVRWADLSAQPGAGPQVVLSDLPAPRLGTGKSRSVRLVRREGRRARVEVPVPLAPNRRDWLSLLGELAHQLNDGRVYDRDLPGLARALEPVVQAHRRRAHMTGARTLR
jgi:hypothetical protein